MLEECRSLDKILRLVIQRIDILEAVHETQRKRTKLQRDLDQSRSTVYRALSQLEEANLVTERDGVYELTTFGSLLFGEYREFRQKVSSLWEARELFETARDVEQIFDPAVIYDADIHLVDECAPTYLYNRIADEIADANKVRGVARTVSEPIVNSYVTNCCHGDLTGDLVYTEPAFEFLQTEFEDEFRQLAQSDQFTCHSVSENVSFELLMFEEPLTKITIAIYDQTGVVRGTIATSHQRVLDWAETTYEHFREQASEVES